MKIPFPARLLFFAFLFLFAFAATYLVLESTSVWARLPATLTHGAAILSGLVLVATLLGHLLLASVRLPADTVGRRS